VAEVEEVTLAFKDVSQATLEGIMADAVIRNKIVFIDFYTTWCGPCKWMDNNVFNQSEVATKLNRHFVNYKVDAEDFEGVNTALKYRVSGYPTYVFLTPHGEVIHRLEGMIPVGTFMQVVDEVLSERKK
jgi:thiol:disulfide interchange protein